MLEIQIFENPDHGSLEWYEQDGTIYLNLEQCARGLGFTQNQNKNGNVYTSVRWERIEGYLKEFGFSPTSGGKGAFIPENIFYRLAMKAKNEVAERFQAWIADEVLPSIRKNGGYALTITPAEMLLRNAQILVEQERKMRDLEKRQQEQEAELKEIAAKMETHPTGWYTVAGYASKIGMNLDIKTAGDLGRKATRLSKQWGKKIQTTPDPRFGKVNVYCPEVLEKVFEEMD